MAALSHEPYPDAERLDVVDRLHGHDVPDPYRWLEDADSAATVAWSEAEDRLWQDWADAHPERQRLADRLAELVAGYRSAPTVVGERRFWAERSPGQDHAAVHVADQAGTRVLVDPNAIDPAGTTTLDGWAPSVEGDRLAYLLSSGGDEESRLWVIDVATCAVIDGPIDRVRYSPIAWLPGGDELLYVRRLPPDAVPAGEEMYHRRLWRHRVGTDPGGDVLLFGADGLGADVEKTAYLGVDVSRDGRWAAVTVSLGTAPRNDLYVADLDAAGGRPPAWVPAFVGGDARAVPKWDDEGRLWLWTDLDAPRGRLVRTSPAAPAPGSWAEVVGEDPEGASLEGFVLAGPHVVVATSRHALSSVAVHDRATGARQREVALPGPGTVALHGRPDDGQEAWVEWTGWASPQSAFHLDPATGVLSAEPTPWPAPAGPGVWARQVSYCSADGTAVRLNVISPVPPGAEPDRSRPTLLYGYGGFSVPLGPEYSPRILAWVEAGGVWAVANLRGGSEEGEAWHRDGMREHKHHVFEDFDAAADWLVANGWTTPGQLGIMGASNGGLLVGAALTRSPERYRAVVCSAPLLDMVRYEDFGLGASWNDEFGSAADPAELDWLVSYSPYHHVRQGTEYPAVLFTIFDSDTRVDTMHARKMAAGLQWATAGDPGQRPVLLRREAQVGHGPRSVRRSVELEADQLVFLGAHVGLDLAGRFGSSDLVSGGGL